MKGLLEDSDEQVDQKDIGDQEVSCHEGRGEPGTRDARWELLTVLIVQVFTTGCCGGRRWVLMKSQKYGTVSSMCLAAHLSNAISQYSRLISIA